MLALFAPMLRCRSRKRATDWFSCASLGAALNQIETFQLHVVHAGNLRLSHWCLGDLDVQFWDRPGIAATPTLARDFDGIGACWQSSGELGSGLDSPMDPLTMQKPMKKGQHLATWAFSNLPFVLVDPVLPSSCQGCPVDTRFQVSAEKSVQQIQEGDPFETFWDSSMLAWQTLLQWAHFGAFGCASFWTVPVYQFKTRDYWGCDSKLNIPKTLGGSSHVLLPSPFLEQLIAVRWWDGLKSSSWSDRSVYHVTVRFVYVYFMLGAAAIGPGKAGWPTAIDICWMSDVFAYR